MNGVICLEGFWFGDHRDQTSVVPILDLLHRYHNMPFIHHRCATVEEFNHSLNRWSTKSFNTKYPILYLAFHGDEGKFMIGKEAISLDHIAEVIGDKCSGSIIHFGSCSTMKIDKRHLQSFMKRTQIQAVMGYKKDIDWLYSTSFELLLLYKLLEEPLDNKGLKKIFGAINADYKKLIRELEFRSETSDSWSFPRIRNK